MWQRAHAHHAGTALTKGRARVPLNAPIDIEVMGAIDRPLTGVGIDGRSITLKVTPLLEGRASLDLAILVDRSGSMSGICTGARRGTTKHQAVIAGLTALASRFRNGDAIDLWEFDDTLTHVGSTRRGHPHIRRHDWRPRAAFEQLVRRLQGPGGGTEIGAALDGALRGSRARDLLLITDGKSYALDVQRLAQHGRRIAVVLVGEDSLEANVGHLAAVTGGSVFVARGDDIAATVAAAAETLRSRPVDMSPIKAQPMRIEAVRGGALVKVAWSAPAAWRATCRRRVSPPLPPGLPSRGWLKRRRPPCRACLHCLASDQPRARGCGCADPRRHSGRAEGAAAIAASRARPHVCSTG